MLNQATYGPDRLTRIPNMDLPVDETTRELTGWEVRDQLRAMTAARIADAMPALRTGRDPWWMRVLMAPLLVVLLTIGWLAGEDPNTSR